MTPRTMIATALAASTILLGGCNIRVNAGGGEPPASTSVNPTETATAVEKLRAGTSFVDETSFRYEVDIADGQITTLGHADNAKKRADATVRQGDRVVVRIRMVDDDIYLSGSSLPGAGTGWYVLDPARVPPNFALTFAPGKNDPGGSARLIGAIVSADLSGVAVTGTMDINKVGTGNGITFRGQGGAALPDVVNRQPFTATLDDQGRLISFLIPAADGVPAAALRYSEFGVAVDVSRPSDPTPAPDALYAQLGLPG